MEFVQAAGGFDAVDPTDNEGPETTSGPAWVTGPVAGTSAVATAIGDVRAGPAAWLHDRRFGGSALGFLRLAARDAAQPPRGRQPAAHTARTAGPTHAEASSALSANSLNGLAG